MYVARLLDEPRPFDGVLNEVPAQIYAAATDALAAIARNGYLPGQTKSALQKLKATYLLMSLGRDALLERRLDELGEALSVAGAGGRAVSLERVTPALHRLCEATVEAVLVMAELRPEVWGRSPSASRRLWMPPRSTGQSARGSTLAYRWRPGREIVAPRAHKIALINCQIPCGCECP